MIARNQIMMRVENIADIYNSDGQVQVKTVNLQAVITGLWELANNCDIETLDYTVTETSLTGNQSYQTMTASKIKWLTFDDATTTISN